MKNRYIFILQRLRHKLCNCTMQELKWLAAFIDKTNEEKKLTHKSKEIKSNEY